MWWEFLRGYNLQGSKVTSKRERKAQSTQAQRHRKKGKEIKDTSVTVKR